MFFSHIIAERKIQEAIRKGELDNLPGKGKPLDLEDESHIPEELRLAYKILKNADCLPPELELKKEITHLKDLLQGMEDVEERYRLAKRLNFQIMKLNMTRRVSPLLEEDQVYYEKVAERLAGKGASEK
ncbi:MAG TPA: DnaJ family domain-containing protein [Thermodesulfobacteriota bacterium]|nr:DnaJ family domain-containing protein [Thermodesulfobacteriota bacterium]